MDAFEDFNTDVLIAELGGCSRFQTFLTLLLSLTSIPRMFSFILMTFGMYNPGWRCLDNMTSTFSTDWTMVATTVKDATTIIKRFEETNQTVPAYQRDTCHGFDTCQHVEFNPEASTIVTEWGLACNRAWILSTMLSLQMAGNLCSTIFVGYIGDRCGRKIPLILSTFSMAVLNLVSLLSVSWQMYAVSLFFIGLSGSFVILSNILTAEFVTASWRVRINSIPTWSFVMIAFAVAVMFSQDWKKLRLISTIGGFISLIPLIWIPESIRWLSIRGKGKQALQVAKRVAKLNKAPEPQKDHIDSLIRKSLEGRKKTRTYTFIHLFRKGYRLPTFIVGFLVFTIDFIYFVFTFGISTMPGDMSTNLIIFAVSDLPANLISFTVANMFRRKPSMFTCYVSAAACLLAVVILDLNATADLKTVGILVFIMVAKLFLYVGWIVLATVILELYPTVVRSTVNGYAFFMANIGAVCAPYLIPTDPSTFYVSYLVMTVLGLVCAGLILLLPETKGKPLMDTWDDKLREEDDQNHEQENRVA